MSARYTAYPSRPNGVTEYEYIRVESGTGGKTVTTYRIYAGEVFCRVKISDASDGSTILCGTTTRFSGRNILLNHIRLQHEHVYENYVRGNGKGKGGPKNAKAKNEAEIHFTEQMILIEQATAQAHLSGLQQINNTVKAPEAAAPTPTHKKTTKTSRRRNTRQFSDFESEDFPSRPTTPATMQDDKPNTEPCPNKPSTSKKNTGKRARKGEAKGKRKKKAAEVQVEDDEVNHYGFAGETFTSSKSEVPLFHGKPNKTKMMALLALSNKARCPDCVNNNTSCPPPQFLDDNWKDSNWEDSTCQLLHNFVQPEVEE